MAGASWPIRRSGVWTLPEPSSIPAILNWVRRCSFAGFFAGASCTGVLLLLVDPYQIPAGEFFRILQTYSVVTAIFFFVFRLRAKAARRETNLPGAFSLNPPAPTTVAPTAKQPPAPTGPPMEAYFELDGHPSLEGRALDSKKTQRLREAHITNGR